MNSVKGGPRGPQRAVLAVAIALVLQGMPLWVHAQTVQPTATPPVAEPADTTDEAVELDSIEVVSYRQSLQKAIDIKRDSTGQVDAIVAEDIGKFPDLNLAESLQRIPGVAITRDAGEGRNVSVRGLGPDFARVRINGMEALTTTGGTDSSGGANRGRGFDFNVFASELFNSITVRKTSSADLEEGSLGATIDLQAARPFDYDGFTFATSAQAGYNDLSSSTDPRAAMLVSNTWADGTFGALMSLAYSDRNIIEEGHSTVRWDRGTSSGGFAPSSPYTPALASTTFHPRIPRYGVLEHDQERLGVTGSLQFQPSDSTLFNFDVMYASFDATRTEDFLEAISFSRTGSAGKPATIVRDGFVDGRGNLVYGVFDNVDVRSESRYDELNTEFTQFTLSGEHEVNDRFRFDGKIGTAESKFDNPIQTTITLDRVDADGVVWDYRNNSRLPLIDYNFDVTNPANWTFANGLSEIRLRPQAADNTFSTGELNLSFDLNDVLTLRGGFLWKEYEFDSSESRRASETVVPNLPAGTTLAELSNILRLNDLNTPNGTQVQWIAPDVNAFNRLFDIYSNSGIFTLSPLVPSARGNNRSVTEEDMGYWMQLDWDTMWGDIPVRGNVGGRYVQTDQSSTGFAVANNVPVKLTVDRDYSDFLPALNVVAEVTPDVLIRFGAAEVMARPGLGNLTPGVTVSVSGGNRTVTGGDPLLDPFRAKTADLSLEWYYDAEALLSLALFYKDIDSFVQTSRETRPFNTSGLPDSLLIGTGATPEDDFTFNIPVNTPGGDLTGFEVSWQQTFTALPGPWSNFGTILNYTYVDSKIQYVTSTGAPALETDLVGLSKNSWNATLYYEGDRFGARISVADRDDFLTTVPGRNGNDVEGTIGTTTVDASASYKLNDQWEISFEALNLTDEFNDQWVDSIGNRASVYHHTGRQYMLGVRFRY
jgi:TonB-dependent receptor